MANLALIQLRAGAMTENLELSIAESGPRPWGFDRVMKQMRGMVPVGTHVAFVSGCLPGGAPLGRQAPIGLETLINRVVLGYIVTGIHESAHPYFDGFPWEFRYEMIADLQPEEPVGLAQAAAAMNELVADLSLTPNFIQELLSNARSAKVGMFYDGMPRRAEYFKDFEEVPVLYESRAPAPSAESHSSSTVRVEGAFGGSAHSFSRAVEASGLVFDGINSDLPKALFAAVAAKRFVLLTGMSGSGKTQLARALGQWFGRTPDRLARYRVVAVRADWTSPEPMLGYEDALAPPSPDGRRAWHAPDTLRFILDAAADPDHPWLLILDEMNLAHVERYFADVLSGIESGEPIIPDLVELQGHWYPRTSDFGKIPLPSNLIIIGTVNVDETTYQFSPKVLDRAFSFEFRVATDELGSGRRWPTEISAADEGELKALAEVMCDLDWHDEHEYPSLDELSDQLLDLHRSMGEISLEFGHRSFRESLRFAAVLAAAGIGDPDQVWDWVVMTKILPRVHGGRRQIEGFLRELNTYAAHTDGDKPLRPRVARKTDRMLRSLVTTQFASFSE